MCSSITAVSIYQSIFSIHFCDITLSGIFNGNFISKNISCWNNTWIRQRISIFVIYYFCFCAIPLTWFYYNLRIRFMIFIDFRCIFNFNRASLYFRHRCPNINGCRLTSFKSSSSLKYNFCDLPVFIFFIYSFNSDTLWFIFHEVITLFIFFNGNSIRNIPKCQWLIFC